MDWLPLFILGAITVFFGVYYFFKSSKHLPLPPGPRGSLFSGVKPFISSLEPWRTYAAWAEEFQSPIISFRVYNQRIIVLNDATAVHDLLEKRANIYSDRPKSSMYQDICDRKKAVFNISSLDPRHKLYRKLLQTGLSARATQSFWPLIQDEVNVLLDGFEKSPEKYEKHIRRNAAAVIMKVTYGYDVKEDDLFIQAAEEASKISGWAMAPGRWLVNYYPILRFVPSFLPGAGWKRQGEAWKERLNILSGVPHAWVKEQMASGHYTESFTTRHLRPNGIDMVSPDQEDVVKWCAGALYAGAGDTTVSAILSFVRLMAVHQDVQAKVRIELDTVVGRDCLPHPSDLNRLIYLSAVVKEVLRYAPVANLALPHQVTEEDVYKGYRIPKDTTIIPNVWSIMHNPDMYPNPFEFSPERFMASEQKDISIPSLKPQPDPRTFAFGFGRRTCPGVTFAETTMMLAMASIIARFNISLPSGRPNPKIEVTSGITSHIKPFEIEITPRAFAS
ncbi:O-methylsterigmatocystin oxidoreductase [Hypsizygus marmoreus]|uniref:O-methylsterigmatocystin oxidoreductase n=1 Tax=Hypsizygus marmoreus TaxID=39966 RepID=A0A369JXR7_HYPMA|nr:O-methylsterigmatocystin oxidoreductase [Hypsizygus marmoreus]